MLYNMGGIMKTFRYVTLFFIFTTYTTLYAQNTPPEFIDAPDEINLQQNSEDYLGVWDIVQDTETEDSLLIYSFSTSTDSIDLYYDDSIGDLTITAINNFFGIAYLYITVKDPQLDSASITITLNVESDNAPPEFVDLPDTLYITSDSIYSFNIWPYAC